MQPEIIEEVPISLSELKEEIEKIKKADKEPGFRTVRTDEHLQHFKPLSRQKQTELIGKLMKLEVPRLKEQQYIKVIDIMPESITELKTVLAGYNITVTKENTEKIFKTIDEARPKKQ
ncbi:hypothetical protein J4475_01025 [Candidatus Woesearchaeota archaeon]|nr:hypothetical protein [Candidatus Woesearchaeota archaeon]